MLGQSKVGNDRNTFVGDQNISWLEIAMDDIQLVHKFESGDYLCRVEHN